MEPYKKRPSAINLRAPHDPSSFNPSIMGQSQPKTDTDENNSKTYGEIGTYDISSSVEQHVTNSVDKDAQVSADGAKGRSAGWSVLEEP